jgi:pimeloyl-ACP methyl ester carboxylesterase
VSTDAGRAKQRVRVESGSVAGNGAGGIFCETAWTNRSGPAMVLTHDGLLHRETWDAQFRAFAQHYRVARWDRRGYGRSPALRAPYSSVDDLVAVIRSISDGRPQTPALGRLGWISVPTLIVVGEADIPDVHAHCGAIEAGIPGASRVVLRGGGHLPHLEVPDAFHRVVLEFLDSYPNR